MPSPETESVEVRHFARVFVDAEQVPAGAQAYKSDRGVYYTLSLEEIPETSAVGLVQKAREYADDVEVVGQVIEGGEVAKERRYVGSIDDVPDSRVPQRGPKGGIYYETESPGEASEGSGDAGGVESEVGYDNQPVLAVQYEDVEEGDRIAFEQPSGERDMGRVAGKDEEEHTVVVDSGDGTTEVLAAPLEGVEEKAEGSGGDGATSGGDASLTSTTEGAHNARYSEDDDDEDEEVDLGLGGEVSKAEDFEAEVFRVLAPDDVDMDFEDDVLGIGVDFPNHDVYVDWRNSVFPDELEHSHVSIYGSVQDLTDATGNKTETIGVADAVDSTLGKLARQTLQKATEEVTFSNLGGDPFADEDTLDAFVEDLRDAGAGVVEIGDEIYGEHSAIHDRPITVEGLDPTTIESIWRGYEDDAQGLSGPIEKADEGEGVWTYYYGPQGGEGWMNVQTGEIRYQKQRPGPAPEDGDGYGDWLNDGWAEPPDDISNLTHGQTVEVYDESGDRYFEATVESFEDGEPVVGGDDIPGGEVKIGDLGTELTAVEEEPEEQYFSGEEFGADEYYGAHSGNPTESFESLEVGDQITADLPNATGDITVPVAGFFHGDEEVPGFNAGYDEAVAVDFDDVYEAMGYEEAVEYFDDPEEVAPYLHLSPSQFDNYVTEVNGEKPGEETADYEDWASANAYSEEAFFAGVEEGDEVAYSPQTSDDWYVSEVEQVEDDQVLTAEDHYVWPGDMDVRAPQDVLDRIADAEYTETPADEAAEELVAEMEEYEDAEEVSSEETSEAAVGEAVEEDAATDAGGVEPESAEPSASGLWEYSDTLATRSPDDVEKFTALGEDMNVSHGNTMAAKQTAYFEDGTKAVYTDTTHHDADMELGERAVASAQFARAMFDDYDEHGVPQIEGEPQDGYFFSAAAPGYDVVDAPEEYKEAVDKDEFLRQAGIQVALGNNDAHPNNVKVDEDGNLHWFDMDHAGGSIHNESALNKSYKYDDGWDRILGELAETGSSLGLGSQIELREAVAEAAQEVASDISPAAVEAANVVASEDNSEFADNISANIQDLRNGNIPYEP